MNGDPFRRWLRVHLRSATAFFNGTVGDPFRRWLRVHLRSATAFFNRWVLPPLRWAETAFFDGLLQPVLDSFDWQVAIRLATVPVAFFHFCSCLRSLHLLPPSARWLEMAVIVVCTFLLFMLAVPHAEVAQIPNPYYRRFLRPNLGVYRTLALTVGGFRWWRWPMKKRQFLERSEPLLLLVLGAIHWSLVPIVWATIRILGWALLLRWSRVHPMTSVRRDRLHVALVLRQSESLALVGLFLLRPPYELTSYYYEMGWHLAFQWNGPFPHLLAPYMLCQSLAYHIRKPPWPKTLIDLIRLFIP